MQKIKCFQIKNKGKYVTHPSHLDQELANFFLKGQIVSVFGFEGWEAKSKDIVQVPTAI